MKIEIQRLTVFIVLNFYRKKNKTCWLFSTLVVLSLIRNKFTDPEIEAYTKEVGHPSESQSQLPYCS